MYSIPDEVNEECYDRDWHTGETVRIKHIHTSDGEECSANKDAALAITRKADGWWWHCFRCGESGFKQDSAVKVAQVEKHLAALRYVAPYKSEERVTLPNDFMLCKDTPNINKYVPKQVYHWLWQNNIHGEIFQKYEVGWSDYYQRCIIPIYEPICFRKDIINRKLVGWIGRDVRAISKEWRKKDSIPKYILRKSKRYNRIYFHAYAASDDYVIVEDVLSAMKVNFVCGVNTVALLTTSIPTSMLLKLKGKNIILWLDHDQLFNVIATCIKGTNLGLNIKHIHTKRDPKSINDFAIMHEVNRKR